SGRNGGFAFAGYSLGEQSLIDRLGVDRARALHARTVDGVNTIRARIRDYAIECDAVDEGVIWANWFRDPEVLRKRQRLLADQFGIEQDWLTHEDMRARLQTERYHDGLFERNALHLHPLKYASG